VPPAAQRLEVIELPHDNQEWIVTLVHGRNCHTDPKHRRLLANLASDPALRSLLAQAAHYVEIATTEDRWTKYYAQQLGGRVPQLWVWRKGAKRSAYSAAGADIPDDPQQLARAIQAGLKQIPAVAQTPPRPSVRPALVRRVYQVPTFQIPAAQPSWGAAFAGGS
jgi:hypothetical protein